jgi:tRNA-dihydrouridine synthase 3
MAMTDNLCKGANLEWSLTRRHPSEDIFGIQVCANDVSIAALAGHFISTYTPNVDFVDLNLGWYALLSLNSISVLSTQ